jgi:ATP-binding cassette subfamily C protein CydC
MDLHIDNLTFRYADEDVPALDQLSLHLPAGRHAALLGASGAGKTSLINLLMRFWDFSQGSITLDGMDIRTIPSEQTRRLVNCLPARPHLFNTTLRKNLLLAYPGAAEEDLWHALHTACLADFASGLPAGLDTSLGQGGARLSAGEAQRLALARFLLQDGALWIMDEPTAHLDTLTSNQVRRQVLAAAGTRSLLWITHDLSGLDAFDWVYILHEGRLIEEGLPADLLTSGGILAKLMALQSDQVVG